MGVASWYYGATTQELIGGHSLILGQPWLAIDGAFISCISRITTISDGNSTKKLVLYPPTKPIKEIKNPLWAECKTEEGNALPLVTVGKALFFKDEIENDKISSFITNHLSITPTTSHFLNVVMNE